MHSEFDTSDQLLPSRKQKLQDRRLVRLFVAEDQLGHRDPQEAKSLSPFSCFSSSSNCGASLARSSELRLTNSLRGGGAKPDRIAGAWAAHETAKVALNAFSLRPRCVIEVPVSVDQLRDGVGIDAGRSLKNAGTSADDFGIHNELPVRAGKHSNVPAPARTTGWDYSGSRHFEPWTCDDLLLRRRHLRSKSGGNLCARAVRLDK
jgi:hypothetical protein